MEDESYLSNFTNCLPPFESDMMVAEDTLLDVQFSLNSFVLGPPYIRFFAAAPIRVHQQSVGMISLIHHEPKAFGPKDISKLTDLAGIISSMIEAKEQRMVRAREDIAKINIAVSYHLRHPLSIMTQQHDMLYREYQAFTMHTRLHEQSGSTAGKPLGCYLNNLGGKLQSFQQSCHELEEMLELSLQLASQHIDSSAYGLLRKSSANQSTCRGSLQVQSTIIDLCGIVKQVKTKLQQAAVLPCEVRWLLTGCSQSKDGSLPTDGKMCAHYYHTYPLVLQTTILSTLGNMSQRWQHVTIQFDYKDAKKVSGGSPRNGGHGGAVGYLEVVFGCTGSKNPVDMHTNDLFEEVVLKGVLSLAGGYLEKSSTMEKTSSDKMSKGERYTCYIPVLELVSVPHAHSTPKCGSTKLAVTIPASPLFEKERQSESCNISIYDTEFIESACPLDASPSIKYAYSKHPSYGSVAQMFSEDEDLSIELSSRLKRISSDRSMQSSVGSGKYVSGVVHSALTAVRSIFESKGVKKVVPV